MTYRAPTLPEPVKAAAKLPAKPPPAAPRPAKAKAAATAQKKPARAR